MKLDKTNPRHWLYLLGFTTTVICATLLRMSRLVKTDDSCLLYGHKLNGNLKAIYDYSRRAGDADIRMRCLTMDRPYFRELRAAGQDVIDGTNPLNAAALARAFCVISDHGLHSLSLLQRCTSTPFLDVWHAIPLKGFDGDDFRTQQRYDKVFVTSEMIRQVYIDKFDFRPDIVQPVGYARTDLLVDNSVDIDRVRKDLGITDSKRKIFLFAPTWKQDDPDRDILPFGESADRFFTALQNVCDKTNALCIFRTHLNSGEADLRAYDSILFRPHSRYPDTEEILLLTDCLVSDWSSIVFDYMLLDRPTIFLDVPHPFSKGLSISADNRFGKLVADLDQLCASLETYLTSPDAYREEFGQRHSDVRSDLYDDNDDGHAAQRIYEAVEQIHRSTALSR